jgi:NADPH:quinone reductase-like Zn-dependent oxidoreductase
VKAIVYTKYGAPDVLQLKEVDKPTPQEDELLVKVHAASANAYGWRYMRPDLFLIRLYAGLLTPKHQILGADVAGQVVAMGNKRKAVSHRR